MNIRFVSLSDAAQIAEIYNYYIKTSHATFELETIDETEMENRIREVLDKDYPFFVCEENEEIIGCAFAHKFKARRAYQHSIEVSVYLKNGAEGKGIGTALYEAIETEARRQRMNSLHAEVSTTAKAFFLRMGFEVVEEQNKLVCGAAAKNFRMKKSL